MIVKGFDIDGVIHLGSWGRGITPGANDIIITGRSFEEEPETLQFLHKNNIHNLVFFNPLPFDQKSRVSSGVHKANTINKLRDMGVEIEVFFEDDYIQVEEMKERCPQIKIVHIAHNLTLKENVRHHEECENYE